MSSPSGPSTQTPSSISVRGSIVSFAMSGAQYSYAASHLTGSLPGLAGRSRHCAGGAVKPRPPARTALQTANEPLQQDGVDGLERLPRLCVHELRVLGVGPVAELVAERARDARLRAQLLRQGAEAVDRDNRAHGRGVLGEVPVPVEALPVDGERPVVRRRARLARGGADGSVARAAVE